MAPTSRSESLRGVLFAIGAYICWGLFPLYWKPLHHLPALEIMCHRVVWSALFLFAVLSAKRHWRWLLPVARDAGKLKLFAFSSSALTLNWLIYIWAVNSGHVVESSLGYFINPLVNVLLGRIFLGERLLPVQGMAVGLACAGVAWLTLLQGGVPWIALSLAFTFGVYGLLRKRAPLPSLEGLALETLLMLPLALGCLAWIGFRGASAFGAGDPGIDILLIGAGVVTAVPLLLFAAGARRLKLATLGLVQYISPSLQLLLGVCLYREPFGAGRALGFIFIWCGLALYTGSSVRRFLRERDAAA
ncbi:EamA family transporter RarD [Paludibacterium yongneupense]|uniref:EamA family transporter RarD n=1 Tax=Paludibacterium yongneupense TaxID=400061 RepID=UPI00040061F9|nr:EamA family transporter RarD [Paludibacterium yongneupense]